jgi:hypothetical protein
VCIERDDVTRPLKANLVIEQLTQSLKLWVVLAVAPLCHAISNPA